MHILYEENKRFPNCVKYAMFMLLLLQNYHSFYKQTEFNCFLKAKIILFLAFPLELFNKILLLDSTNESKISKDYANYITLNKKYIC